MYRTKQSCELCIQSSLQVVMPLMLVLVSLCQVEQPRRACLPSMPPRRPHLVRLFSQPYPILCTFHHSQHLFLLYGTEHHLRVPTCIKRLQTATSIWMVCQRHFLQASFQDELMFYAR